MHVCMDVLSCFCLLGLCGVDYYHKARLSRVWLWAVSAVQEDERLECCIVVPVKIFIMYYTTSLLQQ